MSRAHLLFSAFFALALGCDTPEARPSGALDASSDAGDAGKAAQDSGPADSDAILGDPRVGYAVIQDTTENPIFDEFTADINAVVLRCDRGTSNVTGTWGRVIAETADLGMNVLGPPEIPCESDQCATTIPFEQWIGLSFDVPIEERCVLTVYEAADEEINRFRVYVCTAPQFSPAACIPLGSGGDGETIEFEVPAL